MVGGHARQAAPVDVEPLRLEIPIPVDAVEREQGERRRMGAPDPRPVELAPERPPHRPGEPLVEVPYHHARTDQFHVQDLLPHERLHLLHALADLEPEVDIEQVEQAPAHEEIERDPRQVDPAIDPLGLVDVVARDGDDHAVVSSWYATKWA